MSLGNKKVVSELLEKIKADIENKRYKDASDYIKYILKASPEHSRTTVPVAIDLMRKLRDQKRNARLLGGVFEKVIECTGDYEDEVVNFGLDIVQNYKKEGHDHHHYSNAFLIAEDLIAHFTKDYESGVPVFIKNPELFGGIESHTSIVAEWVEKWASEQPESKTFENGVLCQNFAVCKDPFFTPQNSEKIFIVKEYPRHAILIKEGRKQPVIYTGKFEGTLSQFNKACSAYPYGSDNDSTRQKNIEGMVETLNKSRQMKRTR